MSSQPQDILNDPSQWPDSFPTPPAGTRVLTYVFDSKDASKVDAFVKFIQDTYTKALVSVVKDQEGFTSVTITQFFYNLTKSSSTTTTTEDPTYTATADSTWGTDGCCDGIDLD
jgi:hypothetical protein